MGRIVGYELISQSSGENHLADGGAILRLTFCQEGAAGIAGTCLSSSAARAHLFWQKEMATDSSLPPSLSIWTTR